MQTHSQRVIVGRIGTVFGVHGWLKINSFTEPAENLINYQPWQLCINKKWQEANIVGSRLQGQRLIIQLMGCDNPEQAQHYVNADIAVWRNQLSELPPNEYYWTDLEGLTVINKKGIILGTVDHLLATGSNDVLVVKGNKEYLIPYLPDQFIEHIDMVKKQIIADWDEDF